MDFNTLTKKEKRIAVLKDAISQIEAKRYLAETGTYCSLGYYDVSDLDKPYHEKRDKIKCTVCARGALLLSLFCLDKHSTTIEDLKGEPFNVIENYTDHIFSYSELHEIEAVFELADMNFTFYSRLKDNHKVDKIVNQFEHLGEEERLIAIFNHIIKNDGVVNFIN